MSYCKNDVDLFSLRKNIFKRIRKATKLYVDTHAKTVVNKT